MNMILKNLLLDQYKVEINFIFGRKEDLTNFLLEKEDSIVFYKKALKDELFEEMNNRGFRGLSIRHMRNLHTGYLFYIMFLGIDNKHLINMFKATKNKKLFIKQINASFSHELRHITDFIVLDRKLFFDDLENTACISGYLGSEFSEPLNEFIYSNELDIFLNSI